ncbi:complement factor I isoform X5 [Melanotaenia boesemani]|uniref:complement factor I isoform X5 n=1 Tax=Melanotaenia boesemani TaxID=1250792 RepID=UPI001C04955D|nr:complement factor I isoform X5 [Melanotaenia boesemani]
MRSASLFLVFLLILLCDSDGPPEQVEITKASSSDQKAPTGPVTDDFLGPAECLNKTLSRVSCDLVFCPPWMRCSIGRCTCKPGYLCPYQGLKQVCGVNHRTYRSFCQTMAVSCRTEGPIFSHFGELCNETFPKFRSLLDEDTGLVRIFLPNSAGKVEALLVCHELWDMAAANVACKGKNHPLGAASADGVAYESLKPGDKQLLKKCARIHCQGYETSLAECEIKDTMNINHNKVAAVKCYKEAPQEYGFVCTNSKRISLNQTCDGVDDCGDRSDEMCCKRCRNGAFRCKTGVCVHEESLRDGLIDCLDGEDESEKTLTQRKTSSVSSPAEEKTITAEPGHDVSLPCRAGHDGDIVAVRWLRDDLGSDYVLSYKVGSLDPVQQHPSFQNRVHLKDRQMKDGDMSLILKNVTTDDKGTYKCRISPKKTGNDNTIKPIIITIRLEVSPAVVDVDATTKQSDYISRKNETRATRTYLESQLFCGIPNKDIVDKEEHQRSTRVKRVVGGVEAKPTQIQWQIALQENQRIDCGGAYIGGCWVLTAAHCVRPNPKAFQVKFSLWKKYGPQNTTDIVPVKEIIIHPRYVAATYENDIALVRLMELPHEERCMYDNPAIRSVCVPWSTHLFQPNHTCSISGWGRTKEGKAAQVLLWANVSLIAGCESAYKHRFKPGMMCAGDLDGSVDSCQGDSGGPLVCQDELGVSYLWGIVSWGERCGQPGFPGVYTQVAHYYEWIRLHTGWPAVTKYNN